MSENNDEALAIPEDPEERAWLRSIQYGMVKHLNNLCLILDNKTIYSINPDDYTGLDNITLVDNLQEIGLNWKPKKKERSKEGYGSAWITLNWGMDNIRDYLVEINKNGYWVRYEYTGLIRAAIMWRSRTIKAIKAREKPDDDGE